MKFDDIAGRVLTLTEMLKLLARDGTAYHRATSGIARNVCAAAALPATARPSRGATHRRQRRTFLSHRDRHAAIQSCFQHLESRYGNLSSLFDTGPPADTLVSDDGTLRPEHLLRLFQHRATAVHVKNFFHPRSARALGEELAEEARRGGGHNWKVSTGRGLESSDVTTLGAHSPYNVAAARDQHHNDSKTEGSPRIDEYFEGVRREFRARRRRPGSDREDAGEAAEHYRLWPLDKLRLELEEAWPSGAGLAREARRRRPFGGGLPRIMRGPTRWKRGFIHVDELGPLAVARGLFSANIYLTAPGPGGGGAGEARPTAAAASQWGTDAGALHVWPLGVRSRWDWYRNAVTLSGLSASDPATQLHLRHALGPPNVIRPAPGDLVLLCAQRPHCAVGFEHGVRVSLQCFLEYNGPEQRLLIDC